jgi:ACS family hexuronate transporter-like MFS transporter
MAGSVGGILFAAYTGSILQWTHSYATLFAIAASAYIVALAIILLLAPGLRKVQAAA